MNAPTIKTVNLVKINATQAHQIIDQHIEQAGQHVVNASIAIQPYRRAGFRAQALERAIVALQQAHSLALMLDVIENAKQVEGPVTFPALTQ